MSMLVQNKIHLESTRGVWAASPPPPPKKAEEIFKKIKQNQNGGFSLFIFLLFGKAPYIPKIMSLLPS